jgi:RNA polymerase sigma factor (sigma-70 family)
MTVHNDQTSETDPTSDAGLILRTRSGDGEAFGELWRRHYPSGLAVARSVTSNIDPDDLVQESYARIYQAVLKGGGPNGSFRAYLFTSIRNTAAAWGRSRRETAMDDLDTVVDPGSTEQATNDALDRGLTAQAFRSLPTRWQEVLWYSEIEQMKPAAIAPLLGMKAGAVSQLAFRAREGLREAWVQAHLRSTDAESECHWTIEHLGAYSRGNVSTRDRARIDDHLESCARCSIVAGEANEVSSRLALVLLPLVLGITGASAYAATLQAGTVPAVAIAAMPSSVITGGVVVTGASPAGIGAAASSGAGAAGGSAVSGVGALVGAGSAALLVAGVVAAATIVPGLVDANPMTSLPGASNTESSSISSDVAPDSSIESNDTFVLEVPAPKKPKGAPVPRAQQPVAPPADNSAPVEEPPLLSNGGGSNEVEPTDPTKPTDPTNPVDPTDPTGPTDPTEPTDPTDPTEPTDPDPDPGDGGEPDPGDGEGGIGEPGPGEGGEQGPGNGGADPDPTDPSLTVGVVSLCLNSSLETVVSVEVNGAAEAGVQPFIDGSRDGTRSTVLSDDGSGIAILKPTLSQILFDADVTFAYVDLGPDLAYSTTLHAIGVTTLSAGGAPLCDPEDTPAPPVTSETTVAELPAPAEPTIEDPAPPAEPAIEQPAPARVATEEESPAEDTAPAE